MRAVSRAIRKIALGVDVREGEYLAHLMDALEELRPRGHRPEVLFLEAADETLVRRYHETRRRHPLAGEGNVLDGIRAERKRARPSPRGARIASSTRRGSPCTS